MVWSHDIINNFHNRIKQIEGIFKGCWINVNIVNIAPKTPPVINLFQLYQYFMWAGIQIFASVLMYLICRRVQAPLDEYKKRTLEGDAVEMTNTQDKREAS